MKGSSNISYYSSAIITRVWCLVLDTISLQLLLLRSLWQWKDETLAAYDATERGVLSL